MAADRLPAQPVRFECPYRILFGPLYFPALLGRWMGHPNLRTFNFAQDVRVTEMHHHLRLEAESYFDIATARFADVLATLPPGWEPDLVIWYNAALMGIPPGIEDCPYPTLGVIHDWPLNFQPTLDYAGAFDYIVAERGFLDALAGIGFERAEFWPCYAHDPTQHYLIPGLERPYDVTFLGNMDYYYHRHRNPWLERLARMSDRYNILISDRYYRDDFTRLLNQSKMAFNFAVRGEMNIRIYEIAACGAVVLTEEDNLHVRDFLVDGESCVLYNADNFEARIARYLDDDAERQRIARNGIAAIGRYDYEHQFADLLALVPRVQAAFASGARRRFRERSPAWRQLLSARHLSQSLIPGSPERGLRLLAQRPPEADPRLEARLQAAEAALSLNRFCQPYRLLEAQPAPSEGLAALHKLAAAVAQLPEDVWQLYNLACGATLLRQPVQAAALWQQVLPRLDQLPIDFEALSWIELLPRGYEREAHDFNFLWDKTAGDVLGGHAEPEALRRLLQWQAWELYGYALMWLNQTDAAIQALLQAEAWGPGSYYTYAPLLQLLLRSGRQQPLRETLERATARLGLIETLQRDLIHTLVQQRRWDALQPVLHFYRQLMQVFEGGSTQGRESIQGWIPHLMSWLPELLEIALTEAGLSS